ncbi:hypothetical protein [Microvirga rosea]|uniref:hypothetical protein n=1 Tax=Microvirga rosea TaxID=2715425 RepID=UPI001D0AB9C1|nr:hypothetical protein [Microvirga rosea]MCB8821121.1 hypothetical protein [Microvirga rosea]
MVELVVVGPSVGTLTGLVLTSILYAIDQDTCEFLETRPSEASAGRATTTRPRFVCLREEGGLRAQ